MASSKKDAESWLYDDEQQRPFSFCWICDYLGLDIRAVRKHAKLVADNSSVDGVRRLNCRKLVCDIFQDIKMRKQTRDLLDGNSDSTPGKRGAPSHQPTEKNKATVLKLAKLGVPQNIISIALAIDVKTLHKYYSNQLDEGKVHVVESLLQTAQQRAKNQMLY